MPQLDYQKRRRRPRLGGVLAVKVELVRKIVFAVSSVVLVCTTVLLLDYYVLGCFGFFDNSTTIDWGVNFENTDVGVIEWVVPATGVNANGETPPVVVSVEILEKYRELFEANKEFVGFLSVNEHINYPVVWREYDNDFYLNHNFELAPMERGTVFADGWGRWSYPDPASGQRGRPDNVILHGHDLRVRALFAPLKDYVHGRRAFDFLKANSLIRFDTLFEEGQYKVFAVAQMPAEEYLGEVFPYWQWSEFVSDDAFYEYVVEMLDRSRFHTDVDLRPGDEILTLSTCDPTMFSGNVRIVISARRVREGESVEMNTDEFVDLLTITRGRNENGFLRFMMFDHYYRAFNNRASWVGRHSRNWDTSRVEGLDGFLARHSNFAYDS